MPLLRGRDAVKEIREMGYTGTIIGVTGVHYNTFLTTVYVHDLSR
jgi:hypothetical protein